MKKSVSNKFLKRVLGMESLENRELLSVSPLGVNPLDVPLSGNNVTDYGQYATAQEFHTEGGGYVTYAESKTTYRSVTFEYNFDWQDHYYYKFCVAELGEKITGTIAQGTAVVDPAVKNTGDWTVTGLTAGKTYYFEVWRSDNGSTGPYIKDEETDIDISTVTFPETTDAKLIKTGFFPCDEDEHEAELELYLSGLPLGYTESNISITGTHGILGTENVIKNEDINFIEGGNDGTFLITIKGLDNGDKVKIS
ncbi:MAG: hypothetical protein LBC02_12170, partial [Planctomycetaceae bacterium]|nr:hypothetical protein [Planctomycetaceae bacterium]